MIDEGRLASIVRRHDTGGSRNRVEGDETVMELVAKIKADRTEIELLKAEVVFLRKLEPCEVCQGTEVMCYQCHNPRKGR